MKVCPKVKTNGVAKDITLMSNFLQNIKTCLKVKLFLENNIFISFDFLPISAVFDILPFETPTSLLQNLLISACYVIYFLFLSINCL